MKTSRFVGLAAFGLTCALVGACLALWLRPGHTGSVAATDKAGNHATASEPGRPTAEGASSSESNGGKAAAAAIDTPIAVLRKLALLKSASTPQSSREVIAALQRLRDFGASALPEIRAFLRTGEDVDYGNAGRGLRAGTLPLSFTTPPSLRLGLLDVVKDIGGPEAESMLVAELRTTGRGVEVAYLSAVLQQLAPEKYRDLALGAARDLLGMPLSSTPANALDRGDRGYVYGVLATLGDTSFVNQARAELIRPDGRIETGALQYLQQTLKADSLEAVANAWQDPRVPATQKEPLARAALAFVGTNDRADALYRTAVAEPALSPSQRQNLIEDLNETGFADPKHLTPADLPVVLKRLALVEQLAPQATDPAAIAGFAEARKDLIKMRDDLVRGAPGH